MSPTDVLFISNIFKRAANKVDKLGVEGAFNFMANELKVGVKEYQNGERKALTEEQVIEGRVRGDRK